MSKASGQTQYVSETTPPSFQQPFVNQMLSEAQRLYQTGGPQRYPGSTIAPFSQAETQAQEGLIGAANTQLPAVANQSQQGFEHFLTTGMNPDANPYVQQSAQNAIRPIFEQLTQQVLPQVRQGAMAGGGFGGSRQSLAEALAINNATRTAGDITTNIYSDAYNQGQNRGLQALQLGPSIQNQFTQPYQAMSAAGAQQRQLAQAQLEEQAQQYSYDQALPFTNLAEYANYLRIPYGGRGEQTTVGPPPSTAAQLTGGGLTLAALLAQIFGGRP